MENYFDQFDDDKDGRVKNILDEQGEQPSLEESYALSSALGANTAGILSVAEDIIRSDKNFEHLRGKALARQSRRSVDETEQLANETTFNQFFGPFVQGFASTTIGTFAEMADTAGTAYRLHEEAYAEAAARGEKPPGPLEFVFGVDGLIPLTSEGRKKRPIPSLDTDEGLGRMNAMEFIGKELSRNMREGMAKARRENPAFNVPKQIEDIRKDHFWGDLGRYVVSSLGSGTGSFVGIAATSGIGMIGGLGRTSSIVASTLSMGAAESRRELKEAGVKDEATLQRFTYLGGAVMGTLEAITPIAIMNSLSRREKRALSKYVLWNIAKSAGKASLTEGVTEALQEGYLAIMASYATGNELNTEKLLYRMRDGGIVGFLTGGFLGGAGGTAKGFRDAAMATDIANLEGQDITESVPSFEELREEVKQGVKEGIQETVQETAEGTVGAAAETARQAGAPAEVVNPIEEVAKETVNPKQPVQETNEGIPQEETIQEDAPQPISLRNIEELPPNQVPESISQLYDEYDIIRFAEPEELGMTPAEYDQEAADVRAELSKAIFEYNRSIGREGYGENRIGERTAVSAKRQRTDNSQRNIDNSQRNIDNSQPGVDNAQLGNGGTQRADGTFGRRDTTQAQGPVAPGQDIGSVDMSISDLVTRLMDKLGVSARKGRIRGGSNILGQVVRDVNALRYRIPNDIETMAHEGGHVLQNRHKELHDLIQKNRGELDPLAITGDIEFEGFAEFFRVYVNNHRAAKQIAPKFYDEFEALMGDLDPELMEGLEQVHNWIDEWMNAPMGARLVSEMQTALRKSKLAKAMKAVRFDPFGTIGIYADEAYTALVDKFNPVNNMVKELTKVAARNLNVPVNKVWLKAVNNAYKLARLAPHAYQKGHSHIMHGVTPYRAIDPVGASIRDSLIKAFGGTSKKLWNSEVYTHFNAYLAGRRLLTEWARYEAGDLLRLPSKLSKADIENDVAALAAAYPQFETAADMVYEYMDNILKLKYESGMITEEQYIAFGEKIDYVPLMRDMRTVDQMIEDEAGVQGDNRRGGKPATKSLKDSPIKGFQGSTRDIINPIESIMRDTYELEMWIHRNETIKALHKLALAAGNDAGKFVEEIPNSKLEGRTVNVDEVLENAAREAGMDVTERQMLVQTVQNVLGEDAVSTIWRSGEIIEGRDKILYYWENGQRRAIQLIDNSMGKQVHEMMTTLGVEATNDIIEFLAIPANVLRSGITTAFDFIGANFIRDQVSAGALTEDFTPFVDGFRGAKHEIANDIVVQRMNRFGTIMGGAQTAAIHNSRVKQDAMAVRRKGFKIIPFESWSGLADPSQWRSFFKLTEISETATRAAVFQNTYKRSVREGLNEHEAAVEAAFAANDYLDFSLHGSKTMILRKLIPFFSAAINGLNTTVKTFQGIRNTGTNIRSIDEITAPYIQHKAGETISTTDTQRTKDYLPLSYKATLYVVGLVFAGNLLSAMYDDDPEYYDIPQYIKSTHWVIKVGDGIWLRIPKPFELGMGSNTIERLYERFQLGDETALERYWQDIQHSFFPPVKPTFMGFWEMMSNYDMFRDREIVPLHLKGRGINQRYDVYTSELGKWFSNLSTSTSVIPDISPLMVDFAVKSFGGSWGREILNASNAFDADRPSGNPADWFFVRRFTYQSPRGSRTINQFWKTVGRVNADYTTVANDYRNFVKAGNQDIQADELIQSVKDPDKKAYALLEGHHKVDQKRLHPLNRAKTIGSMTNSMKRELLAGDLKRQNVPNGFVKLSPDQKRDVINILSNIQNREMSNALKLTGIPGWRNRPLLEVKNSEDLLKEKFPQVYKEYKIRHKTKTGKIVIKSFSSVQKNWPRMKEKLLKDGAKANLLGFR